MDNIQPQIVYTPDYDIRFMGLEKLHPFDSCKYSRAWNLLHQELGDRLERMTIAPPREVSRDELLLVHTAQYLEQLKSPRVVAQAVELPFLAFTPMSLIDRHLLAAMRLATMGTMLAAESAMQRGIVINLAGGYHHASAAKGEGFCVYSDVALAIQYLRQKALLQPEDKVLIIDLDAHQGNGYERIFLDDPGVVIMDMYNGAIYPNDSIARESITCEVVLPPGVEDTVYLAQLTLQLPRLLDRIDSPRLALYIAGTDIFEQDMLGGMRVSEQGVLERDKFVFDTLVERNIPVAMMLGGGYSAESYRLVANTARYVIETWGQ